MTRTAFRLALRDIRQGHRGFWIFVSCLFVGVAAITAVMTVTAAVLNGIARDGQIVLGGDISLGTQFRGMTDEQLEFLRQNSEELTEFIEMRALMRPSDIDKSTLVELKAVQDNYPLYGSLDIRGGGILQEAVDSRDGVWGALVDPALVQAGNAEIGSRIYLGNNQFEVTGVIERESDRIGSSGEFGFWPRVLVHYDALEGSGLVVGGSRNFYEYRLRLNETASVAEVLEKIRSAFSETVWTIRDTSGTAPNIQELVERLGVLLSLAGLTTLLVGGIGVSNAVRAYLDTRLTTIAILKCIGGSRELVFRMYLLQILMLSGIAIVIGIAIGALAPVFVSQLVQQILAVPFDLRIDLFVMSIAALYGLVTALLFTLWPLATALNTSPGALFRKAVANIYQRPSWHYIVVCIALAATLAIIAIATAFEKRFAVWFVVSASIAWVVFRLIGSLIIASAKMVQNRQSSVFRLAIANLYRPGTSTSDIVLAIGLGLTVLITISMVSSNMNEQVNNLIPSRAPTFFFVDIQSSQFDEFVDAVGVEREEDLEVMPFIRGRITRIKGMDPHEAIVGEDSEWLLDGDRAFTYSDTPPENASIVSGEWWPENYRGTPLLSVHTDVMEAFGLNLGDSITLNILGRDITGEVANVRELEWQSMQLNFAIMLSPEPLQQVPHSYIATASITTDDEFKVQNRIASMFPNITVVRVKDVLRRLGDYMVRIRDTARGVSAITIIAGILVLAGVVVSENRRRAYESVLLKTLGATKRYVFSVYSLEYLMQGAISAAVASALGTLGSWAVLTVLMSWEWHFVPTSVLYTVLISLAISLTLGILGIWNALKHRPLIYLRNE